MNESPPPEKEPACVETSGPDDEQVIPNCSIICNRDVQLEPDGLPPIISVADFLAQNLKPEVGPLCPCDDCHGELAEPHEVAECLRKFPDWKPSPECACTFDNSGVQYFREAITRNWLDAITTDPWMQSVIQLAGQIKPENRAEFEAILTAEGDQEESGDDYRRIDAVDFPRSLHDNALYGIAGEIVDILCTGSELKPEAVLAQFLCIFGNMLGRSPYKVQDGRHGTLVNVAIVENTADGAKGSSLQAVKRLLRAVDPDYCTNNIKGGYNSSEALIGDITDRVEATNRKGEIEIVEEGVSDKRRIEVFRFSSSAKKSCGFPFENFRKR
jgi:hypothetical protein